MCASTALVQFEQGYQLAKDPGNVTPINFIDDQKKPLVRFLLRILAESLENAFAQLERELPRSVCAWPISFDKILVAVGGVECACTHQALCGTRPRHLCSPRIIQF